MNKFWIIAQILGVISYLFYWSSKFFKTKKQMLIVDYISRAVGILSFVFVKNIDGIKNEALTLIHGLIAYKVIKNSTNVKLITTIITWLITLVFFILGFEGLGTILIIITNSIELFGMILGNEQTMRLTSLIASIFFFLFEVCTKMYGGAICAAIDIIVITVSYIRGRKQLTTK